MGAKEVWVIFTKSRPLEGCSIDVDGCDFYFVEAYVPIQGQESGAFSLELVAEKVKQALLNERLALADIPKLIRYVEGEWSNGSATAKEVHSLASKASASGNVEFGGFRSEEIEEFFRYSHSISESES